MWCCGVFSKVDVDVVVWVVVIVYSILKIQAYLSNLWEAPLPRVSTISIRLQIGSAAIVFAQSSKDDFPMTDVRSVSLKASPTRVWLNLFLGRCPILHDVNQFIFSTRWHRNVTVALCACWQISFDILFRVLRLPTIFALLSAVLTERKIVLVCPHAFAASFECLTGQASVCVSCSHVIVFGPLLLGLSVHQTRYHNICPS